MKKGVERMIVEKKAWPEMFEKVLKGEKNADLRIADFEIKAGDTLVLKEFNPKTQQYSGRKVEKRVSAVTRHDKLFEMYNEKDLKQKGLLLIEMK